MARLDGDVVTDAAAEVRGSAPAWWQVGGWALRDRNHVLDGAPVNVVRSCEAMLDAYDAETFLSQLHERFRLVHESGSLDIELVAVAQLGAATAERRAPFSLKFRGPDSPTLAQRIYRLEHNELGVFELFLVPIGPGRYEAIFT